MAKQERRAAVLEPDAGGIDIGAEEIYAAVPPDRDEESTQRFSTFTRDLNALAEWLGRCGVRTVAMESTGIYWVPLFQILHMQKALSQMNLQIHHVLSDITGVSGLAILDAILAGERDPIQLAKLCHFRVKSPRETVARALEGDFRPEHLFTLGQSLEGIAITRS